MEEKGYQLVEPVFCSPLIHEVSDETTIAILHWLIDELKEDPTIKELPIEIDVIIIYRYEPFPGIGIHYLNDDTDDLDLLIEQKLEELYKSLPFSRFYGYIIKNKEAINNTIQKLKQP